MFQVLKFADADRNRCFRTDDCESLRVIRRQVIQRHATLFGQRRVLGPASAQAPPPVSFAASTTSNLGFPLNLTILSFGAILCETYSFPGQVQGCGPAAEIDTQPLTPAIPDDLQNLSPAVSRKTRGRLQPLERCQG